MSKPMSTLGRQARLGHEPAPLEHHRFNMPIADAEDIAMLIISKTLQSLIERLIYTPPTHGLSVNKTYDY